MVTHIRKSTLRFSAWLLGALLLINSSFAFAKELKVYSDREIIEYGDVITLIVEADFQTLGHTLDYEALKQNFEVLNRQRSNFYQVINGEQSARTRWTLRMLANQPGEITIDNIRLDDVIAPAITINVEKQAAPAPGQTPDFFMIAELSEREVYVQQETLYRLRFYYLGRLVSGNIRPPALPDAMMHTLKEESNYSKQIDGKYYSVYEWVYAFYPQASGMLSFETPDFEGLIQVDGRQKMINEEANELTLKVKPIPADYPKGAPWLPAKSVLLKQTWKSNDGVIHVGDSLERTITLQAFGLRANQLPQIKTENSDSFKVYHQPAKTDEEALRDGMVSRIQAPEVIVPIKAGEIEIPEQKVYWWNVDKDQLESIAIEMRKFDIKPALNDAGIQNKAQADLQAQTPSSTATAEKQSDLAWLIWPLVTTFFAIAWVITLIMWLLARRTPAKVEVVDNTPQTLWNDEWQNKPYQDFYQHIRHHSQQLGYNSTQLLPDALRQQVQTLEAHLYANGDYNDSQKAKLNEQLKQLKPFSEPNKKANKNTNLEQLYPQD